VISEHFEAFLEIIFYVIFQESVKREMQTDCWLQCNTLFEICSLTAVSDKQLFVCK